MKRFKQGFCEGEPKHKEKKNPCHLSWNVKTDCLQLHRIWINHIVTLTFIDKLFPNLKHQSYCLKDLLLYKPRRSIR